MRKTRRFWGISIAVVLVVSLLLPSVAWAANAPVIDGRYDDWAGIPNEGWFWNGNAPSHAVSMVAVDGFIYIHVKANPKGGGSGGAYPADVILDLVVNGKRFQQGVKNYTTHSGVKVDTGNAIYHHNQAPGTHLYSVGGTDWVNRTAGQDSGIPYLGEAAYTVSSNRQVTGDEYECKISIPALLEAMGMTTQAGGSVSITLMAPSVGAGSITVSGTSTGAYAGVAICVAVMVTGAVMVHKKREPAEQTIPVESEA